MVSAGHGLGRVLVVDDDLDNAIVLAYSLEREGYHVDKYTNPIDAMSKFKPGLYDLAVIDYRMPRITGLDFVEKIRTVDKSLRAIILTGWDGPDLRDNDQVILLKKPITSSRLAEEANKLLGLALT